MVRFTYNLLTRVVSLSQKLFKNFAKNDKSQFPKFRWLDDSLEISTLQLAAIDMSVH